MFYAFSCYSSSYQRKYKERFRTKRAKPFLIWLIEGTHISPDQFSAADNDRLLRRIPALFVGPTGIRPVQSCADAALDR